MFIILTFLIDPDDSVKAERVTIEQRGNAVILTFSDSAQNSTEEAVNEQLKTKEVKLDIKDVNQKKVVKKGFSLEDNPEAGVKEEQPERETEVVNVS